MDLEQQIGAAGDHRICCALFMRRLTRKLAEPSLIDAPTRKPAQWRSA
jgi:hypothetical protein